MARRRYQHGSVIPRGNSWELRWKEDVIEDGLLRRIHRSKSAPKAEFPTKRLARRELDRVMAKAGVNSESYEPMRIGTYDQFADRWKREIVPLMSPGTQPGCKSELKAWSMAFTTAKGSLLFKEIDGSAIQTVISKWHTGDGLKHVGPKTIKNRVGTLRVTWNSAREWKYTNIPFPENLRLPDWDKEEAKANRAAYPVDTVRRIMESAEYPYNILWWLIFETHIRRGEACGLDVRHIDSVNSTIFVRRNRVMNVVKNTKGKRGRLFSISRELLETLRPLVEGRKPDEPLFLSPKGSRLHPENLVKRKLDPILRNLGVKIKGTAMHGFRHGSATELDRLGTPMATRQQRLGHIDPDTTMGYTHAVDEEDRKVSAAFGKVLSQPLTQSGVAKEIPEQLSLQLLEPQAPADAL
jgi:integrase